MKIYGGERKKYGGGGRSNPKRIIQDTIIDYFG